MKLTNAIIRKVNDEFILFAGNNIASLDKIGYLFYDRRFHHDRAYQIAEGTLEDVHPDFFTHFLKDVEEKDCKLVLDDNDTAKLFYDKLIIKI